MPRIHHFVVPFVTALVALTLAGCESSGKAADGAVATASYQVGSATMVFTDHSRSTPASNGRPALSYRTLRTLVVYPTDLAGKRLEFPLVVYSHGFGATAASALPTLQALASHGYVVAAPDFPLSTTGLPGGLDLLDYSHQPGDVSFVITQMLLLDTTHRSVVYKLIDAKRIGVAGHSLGAVTTLAVTYNSCCRDARIDAAVEMDGEPNVPIGPEGNFAGVYFKGRNPPLLVVNGTKDTIGPYRLAKELYGVAPSPKFFLSLIGAPHEGFAEQPWSPSTNATIAAFFERYLGTGESVAQIEAAGRDPGVTSIQASPN